jgi:thiamine biosynthesis lipoprotein
MKFSRFRFCILLLLALSQPVSAEWFSLEEAKMGTRIEVQFWLDEDKPEAAAKLLASSMAEFDRIEALMSTYIDSSEMSRINDQAATEPQQISAELFELLQQALELSALTDGAFDITYDSVGYLYDFREKQRPDPMEIAERLSSVDYKNVILDESSRTVSFTQPGVRINLGGIAKGYSVERVIKLLNDSGIKHALATAGGDTRILGDRRDKPWIVGIRDPDKSEAIFTRLALRDEAVSTSGDYERFFIEDGKRYHHILSPADGKPVQGVRSVTIIGPNATLTDGLSTSVFVMGPQLGIGLIDDLPGYEAIIIVSDGSWFYSAGLRTE